MPKEVSQISWKNRISSKNGSSSTSHESGTAANYSGGPNSKHDHVHDDGHHRHDNHHRSNKSNDEGSKPSAGDQLQAAAAWAWLYKHQGSRSSVTEMGKSPESRPGYIKNHYKDSMLQSNMISQAAMNMEHQSQLIPMVRPSRFKLEAESSRQLTPGTPSSHVSHHTKHDAVDTEKISTTDTTDHAGHTKLSTATYKLMNSADTKKISTSIMSDVEQRKLGTGVYKLASTTDTKISTSNMSIPDNSKALMISGDTHELSTADTKKMSTSIMSHVDQSKLSTGVYKLMSTTDTKISTSNMSLPDHSKALMISCETHDLSAAITKKSSTSSCMSYAESQYNKLSTDDSHRVSADMNLTAETPHAYQITWPDTVISATDDSHKDHHTQDHEDCRAGDHHVDDPNHDGHLFELHLNYSSLLDSYELDAVSKRLRETLNHARYKNLKSAAAAATAHDVEQQLDHGSKLKDVSNYSSSVIPSREQIYQMNHQQHSHKSGRHVNHQHHQNQIHNQNGHNKGGFIRNIMMRPAGITPFCKSVEVASYSPLPKASRTKKLLDSVNKAPSAGDDHHIISSHSLQLEPYQKPQYKTINRDEDDDECNDQRHINLSSYSRARSINKASGDSIVSHDHHHFHHHRHLHHHHHHYHHHLVGHHRSAPIQDQQRLKIHSWNSRASQDHSQPEFNHHDGLYIMPPSDKERLPKVRPDIIKKKAAHIDPSLERYIFGTD